MMLLLKNAHGRKEDEVEAEGNSMWCKSGPLTLLNPIVGVIIKIPAYLMSNLKVFHVHPSPRFALKYACLPPPSTSIVSSSDKG